MWALRFRRPRAGTRESTASLPVRCHTWGVSTNPYRVWKGVLPLERASVLYVCIVFAWQRVGPHRGMTKQRWGIHHVGWRRWGSGVDFGLLCHPRACSSWWYRPLRYNNIVTTPMSTPGEVRPPSTSRREARWKEWWNDFMNINIYIYNIITDDERL